MTAVFTHDRSGSADLVMKLVVTSIILSILVPSAYSSMQYYQEKMVTQETIRLIDKIKDAVIKIYDAGVGSSTIIDIALPSYGSKFLSKVVIGENFGELNGKGYCVMSFTSEKKMFSLGVPAGGSDLHTPFVITENSHVQLVHMYIHGFDYIAFRIVD